MGSKAEAVRTMSAKLELVLFPVVRLRLARPVRVGGRNWAEAGSVVLARGVQRGSYAEVSLWLEGHGKQPAVGASFGDLVGAQVAE